MKEDLDKIGYVIVTFDDNTTKILPTTEKLNNQNLIKRPIFCDDLYMVDDVLSGRKERLERFGILEFGDKTLILKKQ
jgi:hypothetical protein